MFKKAGTAVLLIIMAIFSAASADPLRQAEDLTGSIVIMYDENDPEAGSFSFSYRYPFIDESEPQAYIVNSFYREQVEMDETNMLFYADGFAMTGKTIVKDVFYRVTCNNDDFFCALIIQNLDKDGTHRVTWIGNTFSRRNEGAGNTCDLPHFLGLLDESEQDEFLIERQSEKAADIVLELMLEQIYDNPDDIPYFDEITYDYLLESVYPQEAFYLDENGNTVFFVDPGVVADESLGYVVFPIPPEDIISEF